MLARITVKGQVTIPKQVRIILGVNYGDTVDFSVEDGQVVVQKETAAADPKRLKGMLRTTRRYSKHHVQRAKNRVLSVKWRKK